MKVQIHNFFSKLFGTGAKVLQTFWIWANKNSPLLLTVLIFIANVYIFDLVRVYKVMDSYLRLILTSWPAVILILGFWRKDVIDYLTKHLETFELFGAKAKINQKTDDQQIKESSVESAVQEVEKQTEGTGNVPAGENIADYKERIKDLEQALLKETKNKLFERVYRIIYGSQIRLLFDVNARDSVSTQDAAQYYMDAIVKNSSIRSYAYRDYIMFLEKAGLVTVTDPFASGTITITPQGKEFLAFLVEEKLDTVHKEN